MGAILTIISPKEVCINAHKVLPYKNPKVLGSLLIQARQDTSYEQKGTFSRLQVYKRVGISRVKVFGRGIGKLVTDLGV